MNQFVMGLLCLLCSFSVFAGFGNWLKPIRKLLKDDPPPPVERYSDDGIEEFLENRRVFEDPSDLSDMTDDVRDVLRTWSGVDVPRMMNHEEVLVIFRGVFEGMNKNTKLYRTYERLVFNWWWGVGEFRVVMFDSITRENLYKMDYLLKWWDEAKALGREDRLGDFIDSAYGNHGLPWMGNAFLGAIAKAARSSESFARELEELEAVRRRGRSRVIEQDFDIAIPEPPESTMASSSSRIGNTGLPDAGSTRIGNTGLPSTADSGDLKGPSWDEIRGLVDNEGSRSPRRSGGVSYDPEDLR